MANSNRFVSAVVGLTAIVGGAVFGVAVMSSTYAANNFSSKNGFCKIVKPTEKSEQGLCVCPSQTAYDRYRMQHPGAAADFCLIEGAQNRVSSESTSEGTTSGGTTSGGTTSGGTTSGGTTSGVTAKANNGWGNGPDPENNGSFHGNGTSRGGLGSGQSQTGSKNSDSDQR
jgi:hypothetical protein